MAIQILFAVFCLVGCSLATYPPFTDTFPQTGSGFGTNLQQFAFTNGGSNVVGGAFPVSTVGAFPAGNVGLSTLPGSSSFHTNSLQFNTFRNGNGRFTPGISSPVGPLSFGNVGSPQVLPPVVATSPINTVGALPPSGSFTGGAIATPASLSVFQPNSGTGMLGTASLYNSRPLYISPTITSVQYSVHEPVVSGTLSPFVNTLGNSRSSFAFGGSVSGLPMHQQQGLGNSLTGYPSYTGTTGFNGLGSALMGYPSYTGMAGYNGLGNSITGYPSYTGTAGYNGLGSSVTGYPGYTDSTGMHGYRMNSIGYPSYQTVGDMTSHHYGNIYPYGQNSGASFPVYRTGYPQYMNAGVGSFPSVTGGIGGVSGYQNYPYQPTGNHFKKRKSRPY